MRASLVAGLVFSTSLAVVPARAGIGLPSWGNFIRAPKEDGGKHVVNNNNNNNNKPPANHSTFNGQAVPYMTTLTDATFNQTLQDGYWLVKYHSPYCPHCRQFAPAYQTLYEWYYTSKPTEPTRDEDMRSFENYYDFHFGEINCMAYGDTCDANHIGRWPTFAVYNGSHLLDMYKDDVEIEPLARWIEMQLDKIKPGSRPQKFTLPNTDAEEGQSPLYTILKGDDGTKGRKAAYNSPVRQHQPNHQQHNPPAKPVNPDGVSVALTPETYDRAVTTTTGSSDLWFIKYYAPWCGHCQALQPMWAELARAMKGRLNIGEVNCDANPQVCRAAGVAAYPTLYFHRGPVARYSYEGMRDVGDLVKVAERAVEVAEAGVQHVGAKKFDQIAAREEVVYLYVADAKVPGGVESVLERVGMEVMEYARVLATDSEKLADRFEVAKFPRMISYKHGVVESFEPPGDLTQEKNVQALIEWMQSVKMPIVPDLTSSVASGILHDHIVVLGVLDEAHPDQFQAARHGLSDAALEWIRQKKRLIVEHGGERSPRRERVQFAWVQRPLFEQWYQSIYNVDLRSDSERVLIIDHHNHKYWDTTADGKSITTDPKPLLSTLETIVTAPRSIPSHSTVNIISRTFITSWRFFLAHPSFFACMAILSPLITAQYLKTKLRRSGVRYNTASPVRFAFFPPRGEKAGGPELPLTTLQRGAKVD